MKNNVINFNKKNNHTIDIPDDLMNLNDLSKKYQVSYHYLYKWSVMAKKQGIEGITPYYFGALKLSENEVKKFVGYKSELRYGGN